MEDRHVLRFLWRRLSGPEFLKRPINEWPREDEKPDLAEVERECIKKKTVGIVATEAVELRTCLNARIIQTGRDSYALHLGCSNSRIS